MDYKHTCDTIYTHFQGITNNIYDFGRLFAPSFLYPSIHISTRPYSFLPSKWWVDGSLHKAMVYIIFFIFVIQHKYAVRPGYSCSMEYTGLLRRTCGTCCMLIMHASHHWRYTLPTWQWLLPLVSWDCRVLVSQYSGWLRTDCGSKMTVYASPVKWSYTKWPGLIWGLAFGSKACPSNYLGSRGDVSCKVAQTALKCSDYFWQDSRRLCVLMCDFDWDLLYWLDYICKDERRYVSWLWLDTVLWHWLHTAAMFGLHL